MRFYEKKSFLVAVLLVIFFVTLNASISKDMKSLPSPIYGGDYYHQLGSINHIRYGGDPFENSVLKSDNPVYMPVYGSIIAVVANTFNMDSFKAEVATSYFLMTLQVLIVFYLFFRLFKNEYVAAIGVLIFSNSMPFWKYTEFGAYIMAPLIILSQYLFYKERTYKNAIIVAIVIGIASLTHSVLLPISYLTIGALFLYMMHVEKYKNFKKLLPIGILILLIALPISMLYWGEPIFKYHLETSPSYLEWNSQGDFTQMSTKFNVVKSFFNTIFNFSNIKYSIKSSFFILGLFFAFTLKKRNEDTKYIFHILIAFIIILFSYFITVPLFGMHLVPNYILYILGGITLSTFQVFGLFGLTKLLTQLKKEKIIIPLLVLIIIVLAATHTTSMKNYLKNDKWVQGAVNDLNPVHASIKNFLLRNSDVNDVIVTAKETGFALNAITGRKALTSRRAHNDPFLVLDQREMDQAILLYGNDVEKKKEIIKKYDLKFFYYDYYYINTEYTFTEQGQIQSWFDPLIAFNEPKYVEQLETYNVSYFIQNYWVDPSFKGDKYPTYDLIYISPANYRSRSHIWDPNLDELMTKVWDYKDNGNEIASLYQFKI